jgi:hypothetical protein
MHSKLFSEPEQSKVFLLHIRILRVKVNSKERHWSIYMFIEYVCEVVKTGAWQLLVRGKSVT